MTVSQLREALRKFPTDSVCYGINDGSIVIEAPDAMGNLVTIGYVEPGKSAHGPLKVVHYDSKQTDKN